MPYKKKFTNRMKDKVGPLNANWWQMGFGDIPASIDSFIETYYGGHIKMAMLGIAQIATFAGFIIMMYFSFMNEWAYVLHAGILLLISMILTSIEWGVRKWLIEDK